MKLDWAICLIVIFALPPGDAYNFVINVVRISSPAPLPYLIPTKISYPLSVINALISFGIIYLAFFPYPDWPRVRPPALVAASFFGAVNVFLFVVPFIRPPAGADPYTTLPYWTHAVAGWAVFGIGFLYWVLWAQVLPRVLGYKLRRVEEVGKDGLLRHVFRRVALDAEDKPRTSALKARELDSVSAVKK